MKTNPLPEDADALLAKAEGLAAVLSEKREELGISVDVEASLRAGIAAATYAIDAYLAVLASVGKSPQALSYVAEAKVRCDRNVRQLRRRVTRTTAQLCRLMSRKDLKQFEKYLALSA
jgi:hypothetical protein